MLLSFREYNIRYRFKIHDENTFLPKIMIYKIKKRNYIILKIKKLFDASSLNVKKNFCQFKKKCNYYD